MFNIVDTLLEWMDSRAESGARRVAQQTGRRSFITKAGAAAAGRRTAAPAAL